MNNPNLTIMTLEEAQTLGAIQKNGIVAANTDLSLLTGGLVSDYFVDNDKTLKGRAGFFWTRTATKNNSIYDISGKGSIYSVPANWRCRAIRPVLESPEVFSEVSKWKDEGYKVEEVEYGEYPQDAPPAKMQKKLEAAYSKGMNKTGRNYTFDSTNSKEEESKFNPVTYDEYEYLGKRYIRIKANTAYGGCKVKLSNGKDYVDGDIVWIEVSPVKWLLDNDTKKLIAKRGLVSGIRFNDKKDYDGDFNKSEIKKYLDTYLIRDLTQTPSFDKKHEMTPIEKEEIKENLEDVRKKQMERLLLAKQKLKEAAELFNDLDSKTSFDKIKIDNLRQLIFKNNGQVGENGFIEFDDFFRDNELLRIIDLSDLDLENVDITNMDFSGTNIHIDPQTIYNKDMTGVNALDVHFSPFLDSFDDVILDGTKINDKEAIIDLDKVKSYNEDTIIEQGAIKK